ncbi:MAG: hypothetical protein AAGG44_09755 [Planctomycetota bacterium]
MTPNPSANDQESKTNIPPWEIQSAVESPGWLALVARPRNCFAIALLILLPWHLAWISSSSNFAGLPKPVGDGPDYENIAFHLSGTGEYRFNNSNQGWRSAYENANHLGLPQTEEKGSEDEATLQTEVPYQAQLNASRRDFLSTSRPPALPWAISLIYQLVGRNAMGFRTVRLVLAASLAVAGALSVWLASTVLPYLLPASQVGETVDRRSDLPISEASVNWPVVFGAFIALALNLLNATLRSYATDFLTEPFALLFLQLFITALVIAWSAQVRLKRGVEVLAGISLALMILSRSIFVVWLPFLMVLLILAAPNFRVSRTRFPALRSSVIVVGTALLLCCPWWVRNCIVLERFSPLGTQGTITLIGGYCDAAVSANGEWQAAPEQRLRERIRLRPGIQNAKNDTQRELLVAKEASQQLRGWIREHWSELPRLAVSRVITHWNPYSGKSLFWKTLIAVGALAFLWPRKQPKHHSSDSSGLSRRHFALLLIGPPAISTVTTAMLYAAGGRFLVPCYGVLFSLSGVGAGWLLYQSMQLFKLRLNNAL